MATGQILRGWVGQRLDGRKGFSGGRAELLAITDTTTGSATLSAVKGCVALIYLWGAGGAGDIGGTGGGGGGGGASFKIHRLRAGQSITYSVGTGGVIAIANGGDTTLALPNGRTIIAQGGLNASGNSGGLGGLSFGGDRNRNGGNGGNVSQSGANGERGASGGASSFSTAGGGGAAGFSDTSYAATGGAGSAGGGSGNSVNGGTPGGGSGGAAINTGAGGPGRALILLVRPF